MTERTQAMTAWTVGKVADTFGVTVRTLHHYDEIGLLTPSERSPAGYRLYTQEDLTRLQQIVVYRRLELPLEEIAALLDDGENAADHLRRQRATVMSRLDELRELVEAIDLALEKEMSNEKMTDDEMRQLFGDAFDESYAEEAQQRWGETDAWKQSQERTAKYTKADWQQVKAEGDAVNEAFAAAMDAGEPATSERAMDAAELHRQSIERFYDCGYDMQRNLADMYVGDERFTAYYDAVRPGMAQYVRDAIHANADRRS
ncbi:MerR family transcriptional regulator [Blastococcus sp. Marseille-P5729]|uniref:MerR family transcriptional regulator n=1 Tax=Blastococcus sp. Marseille-P5729 TaxID=2086582 RepID=UPI001F1F1937|nr:MerR family transcriptional regulator [Blastococcus sp. Marseille-P5729]